jgi:hypothetical protein
MRLSFQDFNEIAQYLQLPVSSWFLRHCPRRATVLVWLRAMIVPSWPFAGIKSANWHLRRVAPRSAISLHCILVTARIKEEEEEVKCTIYGVLTENTAKRTLQNSNPMNDRYIEC